MMMMLELQQSIFSIQVSAVCLHFVQTELPVFISCLLYFLLSGEKKWLYILKQTQAANISSSGQKYFLSDLPSCWITGTEKHGVFTSRITKQNWNQIIPRISFTVHFEFLAQHTYRLYECNVKIICTSFKCVAARVWYYFRNSPAPCFLITNIGRSLTLAARLFRKPWISSGRLSTLPALYPRWPRVYGK